MISGSQHDPSSEFPPTTKPAVLVVDDDPLVRAGVRRQLNAIGYQCIEAASAHEALDLVSRAGVGLVLLDLGLGKDDGLDVLKRLDPSRSDLPVVVLTGDSSDQMAERAISHGAYAYLVKPVSRQSLQITLLSALERRHSVRRLRIVERRLQHRLSEAEATLERVPCQFADSLVRLSRFRDDETGAHVVRIGRYTEALARTIGFDPARASLTGIAATLHDIGKVGIPDEILRKPGRLTPGEFEVIKTHTSIGARMLDGAEVPLLQLASRIALGHHERWDGSGYPERCKSAECPIEARIVGIVDVYDALSHARVYKPAWPESKVLALFRQQRGSVFDPDLIDAFFACLPEIRAIRLAMPEQPAISEDDTKEHCLENDHGGQAALPR